MQVNAQSTLQLLEQIRHGDYPLLERFVYTSSCSVYGSTSRLPLGENDATHVLSNYAATKLLGEQYTLIYNRNYNIPVSVVDIPMYMDMASLREILTAVYWESLFIMH